MTNRCVEKYDGESYRERDKGRQAKTGVLYVFISSIKPSIHIMNSETQCSLFLS